MGFDGRWKVGLGRWSPHASWHLHGLDFLLVSCELALIWEEGKEAEVLRPEIRAQILKMESDSVSVNFFVLL